jgi:HAMP domain-containing protein
MKMGLRIFAAAALLAFGGRCALALTVPVAQNTYSTAAGKLTNTTGKAASLLVADNHTALLEFELTDTNVVPTIFSPADIESVTLELYVVKTSTDAVLTVHMVTSPWSETAPGPPRSLPSIDSTVLATIPMTELPPDATEGFVSVDITAAAVAALASGSNLSLAIETATKGAKTMLGSKDGPAIGYDAQLDVEAGLGSGVGPPGPANMLTVGTVTSGTVPAVTITGESPDQVINFAIPDGQLPLEDTAVGYQALLSNTSGSENTALGYQALQNNTDGTDNTAAGMGALDKNTSGSYDTASGYQALYSTTSGSDNVAMGYAALYRNTTGSRNTVSGDYALYTNVTGVDNTAFGYQAMIFGTNGNDNTAVGMDALAEVESGKGNIAVGKNAGYNINGGDDNIDIGDDGDDSLGESDTIRIGETVGPTQTTTYIAGIENATISQGTAVYIDGNGQLGVKSSSERFKQDIESMGDASDVLLSLRPVTFQYTPAIDPKCTPQYGLVAEEVEKACPDLVIHDKEGKPYTVRYDAVNAMLLNEFLKEHRVVEEQGQTIAEQQKEIRALTASVAKMAQQIEKVARQMNGKDYQPAVLEERPNAGTGGY